MCKSVGETVDRSMTTRISQAGYLSLGNGPQMRRSPWREVGVIPRTCSMSAIRSTTIWLKVVMALRVLR